jgi:plastocyanin
MNNGTKVLMVVLVLAVLAGVFFLFRSQQNGSLSGTVVPTEVLVQESTPTSSPSVTGGVSPTESDEDSGTRTFTTSAENFSFSLKEMKAKQGDTVRVTLTSTEGMHDWKLDEFGVGTKVLAAGESETVEFVANKKGTFEYYCSVGAHRANGMVGKLIVE